LGDPEFPKSAERLVKGGRIRLYEFVYKLYSTLTFTRLTDRSIAISGLEKRLMRTFNTAGGYGIFDEYLDRSLLWQRASLEMRRITYASQRKVPSWSWMAYSGLITYVDIPFGQVDWYHDVQSPFQQGTTSSIAAGDNSGGSPPTVLTAIARDMPMQSAGRGLSSVIFDEQDMETRPGLKCVVIARDRELTSTNTRNFYVLLIAPCSVDDGRTLFERVGAGVMGEHQISLSGSALQVQIQ
jgi:hypothetical protein